MKSNFPLLVSRLLVATLLFSTLSGCAQAPSSQDSSATLDTLRNTVVPVNDLLDLPCRLNGKCDIPETLPSGPYQLGDRQTFWATNMSTNQNFQSNTSLQYLTDHAYFWVEDGVEVDQGDMAAFMNVFEDQIYPTNRAFFGSEWTPGVDEDPHIYIEYTRGLGTYIPGYFGVGDEFHPDAFQYSNAHERFVLNADQMRLDDIQTYGLLAHEFQHMIHWNLDQNESEWINEGSSELAIFMNGYRLGGFDHGFIDNPDLQLTGWSDDALANLPHYGAAFLFMNYFLNRFGEDATKVLISHAANGLDSIDQTLSEIDARDPLTAVPITADDVFHDWVIANYINDESVADGRYYYHNDPDSPQVDVTETLACPQKRVERSVHQYGADYIALGCEAGQYQIHFEGATTISLLPSDAHSGKYAFWSNKGNQSDMTLTHPFDFTSATGTIEMSYWTWYDLEQDFDYVYVEASTDGQAWQILNTSSCISENPNGSSYGCGYTGLSGDKDSAEWVREKVDLSRFAGQKIQLRFEYLTDIGLNGEGLLLDDVSIPAVDYSTDFETDSGGWEAAGFARVANLLPQTFRLTLIIKHSSGETTVTPVVLSSENSTDIALDLQSGDQAVFVVSGTTRFTRELAAYSIQVK
jgi:immune inhibitor A